MREANQAEIPSPSQLCNAAIAQAIAKHGDSIKDKDLAHAALLSQARVAADIVFFSVGGEHLTADQAIRRLPPAVYAPITKGAPEKLEEMSQAQYNAIRRSADSERILKLRRVTGRGN